LTASELFLSCLDPSLKDDILIDCCSEWILRGRLSESTSRRSRPRRCRPRN